MSGIQQLLLGGSPAGYQIERSLRFNSADTPYLNRTPASAGNRKTWTWSGWIKRSSTTQTYEGIFQAGTSTSAQGLAIGDSTTANIIAFYYTNNDLALRSTQVLRDVSAWYHIVVALDTTQATASNRLRIYLNGSEITTWTTDNRSTAFSQNSDQSINNNIQHIIGNYSGSISSSYSPNGYLTEINFIDGQALTPSSFGQSDPNTGVWSPIKYTGTYGSNGFFLSFSDNSNTTSTTLGKDSSGNGNNWTPNNFSVTAGVGNDSLVDTPTSYGTDTGAGGEVRGNYATWNPLRNGMTLSNGNLAASSANNPGTTGTFGMTSGKWYWEVSPNNGAIFIGLIGTSGSISTQIASSANAWSYYGANGFKYNNGSGASYGATYGSGNVIGVAFDADAGTLVFYKDGVSQGTAYTGLTSGPYFAAISSDQSGTTTTSDSNFGQRPFAYTAPSGFKALCTQNLPTPTIGATSTTQAGKYMNVVLYTGTGASLGVTGVGFQPDWTWIKSRSAATDHGLYDAVRGVQKQLESNNTDAETTETTGLTAFNSDGFTVGALAQLNTNTATYVGWNWKANGAGSSNTSGTITSTVSANTTAGFSIATFTMPASGTSDTVGHGLGVAPAMVIVKSRGSSSWGVYHKNLTSAAYYLRLQTTDGETSSNSYWNSTAPTSTVFTLGATWYGAGTMVAYSFAEVAGYSAFGKYTGNGAGSSAGTGDGPFVYTGFRPRWIMVKVISGTTANWSIIDTSRSPYNFADKELWPSSSAAEQTYAIADILSNGFKLRSDSGQWNTNGAVYIYAAFAESPFKFSLAR